MAHELHIESETGKVSMMYVGKVPWHGLGTKLEKPATAEEAIKSANLDWEVTKRQLYFTTEQMEIRPVKDRFAIVRKDLIDKKKDSPVFGIVGKEYAPLQNREAFSFFDPIVGKDAAIYHTAGALGEGERIWILAKLPSQIQVVGDDITDKFLLLSNSHDGNSSVQIKFTPIRVVCNNTLTMSLSQGPTLRVAHTRDMHARLKNAEQLLGIIDARFSDIEKAFKRMVSVQMDQSRLAQYLVDVFPNPADLNDHAALKRVKADRNWSEYFFDQGQGNAMEGVKGTLWAAYNGVTEYVDHRQTKQNNEQRLNTVWFGDGYFIKARAFKAAAQILASA